MLKISIIIPAHNEEKHLNKCLESIDRASSTCSYEVEKIVILNRCTDATERIAKSNGAITVIEDTRNLSAIRNKGVNQATGDILATIDADSCMSENMLSQIERMISSGKYIGGGVHVKFDRYSLGIYLTDFFLRTLLFITGLSGGLYWCSKDDFIAIGGFNEALSFGEDLDFAKRLKRYGRKINKKYHTIKSASITTSCRKFDKFGDWYFFQLIAVGQKRLKNAMNGQDTSFADEYFYDFDNNS
jgi:glycosyltransferase involved in cell wall biosynthesis